MKPTRRGRTPVLTASALVGVLTLAACGEDAPPPVFDPEQDHCARAVDRLMRTDVKIDGHPVILDAQAWTQEDVRNVRVRFEYPPNPEELERGTALCTYDFAYEVRNDPKRNPRATAIYFRGRYLSETELLLLNAGLRGLKPDYRIKK